MVLDQEAIEAPDSGDLHPIELVAHFLLSDSLNNLHESFLLLHESQHLLLNRLQVLEDKLTLQLELAKMQVFDFSLVRARVKAVNKKLAETRKIFDQVDIRLRALEDKLGLKVSLD